jgi:glycosyltransferase involved in cell wall biosynthesis
MSALVLATTAVQVPMGAQSYQRAVSERAQSALDAREPGWTVRKVVARSLRSPLEGTHRLPMSLLMAGGSRVRRSAGRALYPRDAVVHRMDLLLPPPPGPHVVTLHDVVAWRYDDESPPVPGASAELRAADVVICVSRHTASAAVDLLGIDDPVVIPNGVDERFFSAEPLTDAALAALGVRDRYVLYAGGSSQRKNLAGLAEAWRKLAPTVPDVQLVLAGPPGPARTRLFASLPRVVHVGRVPDRVLPGLVAAAATVVVPSTYEGFGLPALEAMAAGTPLVAADTSSLPEVVGNGGLLVEPTPDALAGGIAECLGGSQAVRDRVRSGHARSQSFTWDRTAAAHAEVWTSVSGIRAT